MATQIQNINKVNAGLCPHGLPPGACPICSNAAGSMRQSDRNRKIGEMTYHECAMIGNMMKARALAQKRHSRNQEIRIENLKNFETTLRNFAMNMREFSNQISSNILLKPIAFVIQNIALPVVTFIQKIPQIVQNFKNIKIDIQDKLNAVFGELKNFIEKKVSDIVSALKEKFEDLFKIFKKHNAEDDDTKIDDDKKIFNLKTIFRKIVRKKKDRNGDNSKDK